MRNTSLLTDKKINTIFGNISVLVNGQEINYSSANYKDYLKNETLVLDGKLKNNSVLECKVIIFDASNILPYSNISVVVSDNVPCYKDNDDDTFGLTYEKGNKMLTIGFYKDDLKCSLAFPNIYGDYKTGIQLYKPVDVIYCVVSWVGDKVEPYKNKQGKICYDQRTEFASDGYPTEEILNYIKMFIETKKPSSPHKFLDYLKAIN